LGIYDKSGRLVRTLHQEAPEKDFLIALNGLTTTWDGKNASGAAVPPGKYSARGYSVGRIDVEGVAFHCNDWMSEENSPRIRQILSLHALPGDALLVHGLQPDGAPVDLHCDREGKVRIASPDDSTALAAILAKNAGAERSPALMVRNPLTMLNGVLTASGEQPLDSLGLPGLEQAVDAARGLDGAVWVIDKTRAGTEVREYSNQRELLRRLAIPPDEPEPFQIVASGEHDVIYLLERNAKLIRLRGLALDSLTPPGSDGSTSASTWKTFLSKSIVTSDTFASVADQLGRGKPFKTEEKIRLRLLPNPLFKEAAQELEVRIANDAEGTFLQGTDGLFLCRVTETPRLKWSVLGREGARSFTLFQSDGAVVEEFKVRRLGNMMAFDAGEFDVAK
ncbi:MAG: hypothetical protein V4710_05240, partial [Verrucomicrobiota bacterium]